MPATSLSSWATRRRNQEEATVSDVEAILARIEALEAEAADLRRQLGDLDSRSPAVDVASAAPLSRRNLLRTAAGGAASLGVAALGGAIVAHAQASPARADGEAVTVGGT